MAATHAYLAATDGDSSKRLPRKVGGTATDDGAASSSRAKVARAVGTGLGPFPAVAAGRVRIGKTFPSAAITTNSRDVTSSTQTAP